MKIGLALSGGGYRAAAYHIGTLKALKDMNILDKVDVISSVSGGSITAAYYALHKDNYAQFDSSIRSKLCHGVLHLSMINICLVVIAIVVITSVYGFGGFMLSLFLLWFIWYYVLPISRLIMWQYDWLFFKDKTLDDLPKTPLVTINATDFLHVEQFTFSKDDMYEYSYGEGAFYNSGFPISRAVMASSCVPFAFNPIRIPKQYHTEKMHDKRQPLLLDGGLYDNQGTHVLTDKSSKNACDYIIVSDAGNSAQPSSYPWNIITTLYRTSDVFMQRIKKVQRQQNLYLKTYPQKRFAYSVLEWSVNERMLHGFVDNIIEGNIYKDVLDAHGITEDNVEALKYTPTTQETRTYIINLLKNNIGWNELLHLKTTAEEHKKNNRTRTNLVSLKKSKINLLSKEAEWKTQIQVRLYLPFLIKEAQVQSETTK